MSDGDGTLGRVGIVVHGGRRAAVEAARYVRHWCEDHGVAWVDIDVWDPDAKRRSSHEEAERAGHLDLVVTLGGDGTFLRGARIAMAAGRAGARCRRRPGRVSSPRWAWETWGPRWRRSTTVARISRSGWR